MSALIPAASRVPLTSSVEDAARCIAHLKHSPLQHVDVQPRIRRDPLFTAKHDSPLMPLARVVFRISQGTALIVSPLGKRRMCDD